MADEKKKTLSEIFAEQDKEFEEYAATFGDLDISLDYNFFTDKYHNHTDEPTNALIEITVGETTLRASIPVEDLLAKAAELKTWVDKANYPRWLDDRTTHVLYDGTLAKVEEVVFNPGSGMYAAVRTYDRNLSPTGYKLVSITGQSDWKAIIRKLPESEEIGDRNIHCVGYSIWRPKE